MLASLNHPNIAHIHGLEESGGVRAIAMERVDGEAVPLWSRESGRLFYQSNNRVFSVALRSVK